MKKSYLRLAPNAMISGKKHRTALTRLLETKKANCSKKSDSDWVDATDELIRVGLSHVRKLKQNDLLRQRCYKKADAKQQEVLEEILQMITIAPGEEDGADEESDRTANRATTPSSSATSTSLALVAQTPSRTNSSSSLESQKTVDFLESGKKIARILQERVSMSSVESGEPGWKESDPETRQVSPFKRVSFTASLSLMTEVSLGDRLMLEDAQEAAPAELELKKSKPKAKAKTKTKAKAAAGCKKAEKENSATKPKKAEKQDSGTKAKQAEKQDSEKAEKQDSGTKDSEGKPQTTGKRPLKEETSVPDCSRVKKFKKPDWEDKASVEEAVPEDAVIALPEQNDPKSADGGRKYKTKERDRVTSKAYHTARVQAEKQGKSADDCKMLARAAHALAAKKYDEENA